MKISQDVRDFAAEQEANRIDLVEDAAAGMKEKSEEFLSKGSEIYHKAV